MGSACTKRQTVIEINTEKINIENQNAFNEEEDKLKPEDGLSMFAERYFLQNCKLIGKDESLECESDSPIQKEEEKTRRRLLKSRVSKPKESKEKLYENGSKKQIYNKSSKSDENLTSQSKRSSSFETRIHEDSQFQRLVIEGKDEEFLNEEYLDISSSLMAALQKREFYMKISQQSFGKTAAKSLFKFSNVPTETVYPVVWSESSKEVFFSDVNAANIEIIKGVIKVEGFNLPEIDRNLFIHHRNQLYTLIAGGQLLHLLLNENLEMEDLKDTNRKCRRDFYNVRKVDTHIHSAACMSQKQLLGFIRKKYEDEGERVVLERNGKKITLNEVFQTLNLDPVYLNVDSLDMHAGKRTFHRFDRFNNLYNPVGATELREIFLKSHNYINGQYFAEILQKINENLVEQKYHYLELRISIYGKNRDEWYNLANWFKINKLQGSHIRWLIQIPRLYDVYKEKGVVDNFQEILGNIFVPLFQATLFPNKNKEIFSFLKYVLGFDSVDDESKADISFFKKSTPSPDEWTRPANPPYTYYLFYMFSNIARLNHLRNARGMNTFTLRPHCGEAGHHDHLLTAFLLAENISHGLLLKKIPALHYLYFLAQIGICMSPLSNNRLFLEYNKNPFPEYFYQGMNVNLSTDDPMQFHFTTEPLIEEYAVAAQVWKLSVCDMCEICRNSVLVSGFPHSDKQKWLGENYRSDTYDDDQLSKTNVSKIRIIYRQETLDKEFEFLLSFLLETN